MLHRLLLLALLPASLIACPPGSGGDPSPSPSEDDDVIFTPPPDWEGSVSGAVQAADGTPQGGIMLTLCGAVCLFTTTENDGSFIYNDVRPLAAVLETSTYPNSDHLHYSRYFDFLDVGENEVITIAEPLIIPEITAVNEDLSGAQNLDLDGGLSISFNADLVELPPDATNVSVGAVELPQAQWPINGLDGWTIERAWALSTWDLESKDGFDITAPLSAGLPPGTEVAILYADYIDGITTGHFMVVESTLAPDGMSISTPEGQGIERLTLILAASR